MVNQLIIHVLGTAQDGGYPHAACKNKCCSEIWNKPNLHRFPASISVVDQINQKFYLFDITPNVKEQLHLLDRYNCELAGIFITHAHLGHYIGLLDLWDDPYQPKKGKKPKFNEWLGNKTFYELRKTNFSNFWVKLKPSSDETISLEEGIYIVSLKNKEFISDLDGELFTQSSVRTIPFRSIGISFKYTIGKLNFKDGSKKTNINNDDIQEDSSNEY